METIEKIILLGALFHDVGKFEQRCTREKVKHEQLGYRLLTKYEDEFTKILGTQDAFSKMRTIVSEHHVRNNSNEFVDIIKHADHLSASERVEFDEPNGDLSEKWSHKFLSSLFSKIYLNNKSGKTLKYYEQRYLTEKNHRLLIPEFDSENDIKDSGHKFSSKHFDDFNKQLKSVLDFYKTDSDFNSLINLLLM